MPATTAHESTIATATLAPASNTNRRKQAHRQQSADQHREFAQLEGNTLMGENKGSWTYLFRCQ